MEKFDTNEKMTQMKKLENVAKLLHGKREKK